MRKPLMEIRRFFHQLPASAPEHRFYIFMLSATASALASSKKAGSRVLGAVFISFCYQLRLLLKKAWLPAPVSHFQGFLRASPPSKKAWLPAPLSHFQGFYGLRLWLPLKRPGSGSWESFLYIFLPVPTPAPSNKAVISVTGSPTLMKAYHNHRIAILSYYFKLIVIN